MNGIVTTIASNSSGAKQRKEVGSTAGNRSPPGSEAKEEGEERQDCCWKSLSLLKRVARLTSCCHVENPHYIDNYSRVFFPLSFILDPAAAAEWARKLFERRVTTDQAVSLPEAWRSICGITAQHQHTWSHPGSASP
ncbi:gamma-aminobutyric acid receptor subunit pi-like isoform X1 [Arapaima gigas]